MNAYEAYQLFLALHQHFYQKNYDYFKYNGKVKSTYDSFLKRKDKYFFHKLSKKENVKLYILSNILYHNDKIWITDMLDEKNEMIFKNWTKKFNSLTYHFKEDLNKLDDNFNDNFSVIDGQHPKLLKLYFQNEISLETITIIDILLGFSIHWNKHINDTIVWPKINQKMMKYKPFLNIDTVKYKKIIVDMFDEK